MSIDSQIEELKNNYWMQQGAKYARIAAPFATFLPVAKEVSNSAVGDIIDIGSHVYRAAHAKDRSDFVKKSLYVVRSATSSVSIRINSLRGQYFASGLGLCLDTYQFLEDLWEKEDQRALKDFSRLISSLFAASILATGSLDLIVVSLIFRAFAQFVFAEIDWSQGKALGAISKCVEGVLIGYRANELLEKLFDNRKVFCLPIFDENQPITQDHPLYDLAEKVDKQRCILTDHEGRSYDMGANFPFMGRDLVKGMNIRFRKKDKGLLLDFEMNHVHRARLANKLKELHGESNYVFQNDLEKNTCTVYVGDTASLSIGTNPAINGVRPENSNDYYLYNRVKVWMPEDKGIEDFRQFLANFNLQKAIFPSTESDITRLKIGQLFRFFHPREATVFEKTEEYFALSVNELIQTIIAKSPDMIRRLDQKHINNLQPVEILPGRVRFAMQNVGEKAKQLGVTSLSAIVTNQSSCLRAGRNEESSEVSYERVAAMLKMGMLAAGVREEFGVGKPGMSVPSHDCVFLQMNFSEGKNNFSPDGMYNTSGKIYLEVSPRVLDRMPYQNLSGIYGARGTMYDYRNRRDLYSYIQKLKRAFPWYPRHEIMVKERVPPVLIKRVIVHDDQERNGLINYLRQRNMIEKDQMGKELVNGRELKDFIVVRESYHKQTILNRISTLAYTLIGSLI